MTKAQVLSKTTSGALALSTLVAMTPALAVAPQCLTPAELDAAVDTAVSQDPAVVAAEKALAKLALATSQAKKAEAAALAAYQKAVKTKSKSDDGPAKKKYQAAVTARKSAESVEAKAQLRLIAVTEQVSVRVRSALEAAQQCSNTAVVLTGVAGNDRVELSWNAMAGVAEYTILRDGVALAVTAELSFTDLTAQNGTTYTYEIASVVAGGGGDDDDEDDDDDEEEDSGTGYHTSVGTSSGFSGALGTSGARIGTFDADDDDDDDDDHDEDGEDDDDTQAGVSQVISNPITLTPVIDIPQGLSATLSAGQVTLTWQAVPNASGYQVWRDGTMVAQPTTASYTETLTASATYTVRAVDGPSISSDSAQASVSAGFSAPTSVHATPGDRAVSLTWDAVPTATSYQVWRGGVLISSPVSTSYSDVGLTNGVTYSYYIVAVKGLETSPASATVTATPAATVVQPPAPTGLQATAGDAQVSLSWNAVANADSYQVLRNGTVVASVNSASHVDSGLTNGVSYSYTVRAVRSQVVSVDSSSVSATPTAPIVVLAAPTNVKVGSATNLNTGKLRVTWDAVTGATGYDVYRDGVLLGSSATTSYTPSSSAYGTARYTVKAKNATPASTSAFSTAVTGGYWQGSSVADQLGRTVYGYIQVYLTFTDGAITGCWATYPTSSDSGSINANAIPRLCSQVLTKQPTSSSVGTAITSITGASATTPAFRTSLQNALTQAGR